MEAVFIHQLIERIFSPQRLIKDVHKGDQLIPDTKTALGGYLKMAWPAVLESILVSMVSLVDNAMVGSLGYTAIASVGLTTQPRFIVLAVFMSLNVGVTAVVSRRKGEGDQESANKTLRQAILISAIASIIISAIAVYYARPLLMFAGAQADTIDGAISYFSIVIGGIFFSVMSLCITAGQRGCGNTRISMITNVAANAVNVVFNYFLIGGNCGFPKLGIAGAAIATTLGYFVAFLIACYSVSRKDRFLHLSLKQNFLPDKRNLSALLNVGASVAVEQLFMRIGFFVFAKIIASLGSVAFSTHQICISILNLSFAFGDGLAIAASSLVGQSLGQKRPDLAIMYGHMAQRIGLIIGTTLSVLFIIFRRFLILPFSQESAILALGSQVLIIIAFMCPAQISQVIYSNCLRVAGDTKYVAIVSLITITFGRTVVAYFFCYTLQLGLLGAWISFFLDQAVRLILNASRFAKGKWITLRL